MSVSKAAHDHGPAMQGPEQRFAKRSSRAAVGIEKHAEIPPANAGDVDQLHDPLAMPGLRARVLGQTPNLSQGTWRNWPAS